MTLLPEKRYSSPYSFGNGRKSAEAVQPFVRSLYRAAQSTPAGFLPNLCGVFAAGTSVGYKLKLNQGVPHFLVITIGYPGRGF